MVRTVPIGQVTPSLSPSPGTGAQAFSSAADGFRRALNEAAPWLFSHSGVVVAAAFVIFVWIVVRRRGRIIRWPAVAAALILVSVISVTFRAEGVPVDSVFALDGALNSGRPVLLEVTSSRCAVCLLGNHAVDGLADEYVDDLTVLRADVSNDAGRKIADRYAVTTLPSFIVFDNSKHVVAQFDARGSVPVSELRIAIRKAIQASAPNE